MSEANEALGSRRKNLEILDRYPLPAHWKPPSTSHFFGKVFNAIFKIMCICGYGQPNLDLVWTSIKLEEEGDEREWVELMRRASYQSSNLLVVAGLLLATSAVFITTAPPDGQRLDWTRRGPYMCICGAFGVLIGGIIVTSLCILIIDKITASHLGYVLYGNTLHVWCTLVLVSYPSVSTAAATLLLGFGCLAAAWTAQDPGFQFGSLVLLFLPLFMGGIFFVANRPIFKENTRHSDSE